MRILLLALALLLVRPVWADESALRTLATGDDTRGWEAVGRLDLGNSSFCTGALIAPDLVLTAAHCLYSRDSGQMIDAREIQFRAGWRNGRAVAYRGARRALAHPDYIYQGRDRVDRVAWDLALIELDQPIRLPQVHPFRLDSAPHRGESVGVVSYAHDRSEAPSLQEVCEVINREGSVLLMSCDADFGSSGAPVFAMRDGEARIVSVVSAKAEMDNRRVSLGTLIDAVADLRAALSAPPGVATGKFVKTGGAKFLRP